MDKFYRNGFWLLSVCLVLILIVYCDRPIRAQLPALESSIAEDANSSSSLEKPEDSNRAEVPSGKCLWWESVKVDAHRLPHRFIEDSKYTFLRTDNITALLLAGGASIAMHNTEADDNIWKNCRSHHVFHGFTDESLNIIGSPAMHFPAAGLWYAIAAENKDELNKGRAYTMLTALSISGATTLGLKAIRNDRPPNGKGWAWPSGHTSSSFTVASVLDEFYGHKVGVPAYLLATVVAYRMVDTGDHWASDCVFGAVLGWVVGHSVAGKYKQLEIAGFDVLPYTVPTVNDNTAMGISLVKQF
jgi:membrane-associated phospholipid phosphatase